MMRALVAALALLPAGPAMAQDARHEKIVDVAQTPIGRST
jgi:hypothetical protein